MAYDPAALRAELERDEGLRRKPYQDSLGYWTVGIGHLLDKPLPLAVIELIYECDVKESEAALDAIEPRWRGLEDELGRVLMNLAFNLSPIKLIGFKRMWIAWREFLDSAQTSQDALERVAREILDSRAAAQTGERYTRLAERVRAVAARVGGAP